MYVQVLRSQNTQFYIPQHNMLKHCVPVLSPQIQYISTANEDGSDERCEKLGWKRLEQYSPSSEAWQLLDHEASAADDSLSSEVPATDEMYFPGQPFASLLSCCKVGSPSGHLNTFYAHTMINNIKMI